LWGFGLVERGSGRLFVEIVQNRSAKTLVPIITKWIRKDTKYLVSDEWRAYSKLKILGYNHVTVTHRKEFVKSDNPEIHTQNIENRWGLLKGLMKRRGKISRANFNERIKEIVWRVINKQNIQLKLLEIISKNINE